MKNTNKIILALILISSVAVTGCFNKKGADNNQEPTTPPTPVTSKVSLSIASAEEGTVSLGDVTMTKSGFVVIYADSGTGTPGAIIGTSGFMAQGNSRGGDIAVAPEMASGATYFAVLHEDNGDEIWNPAEDQKAMHSDGRFYEKAFLALGEGHEQGMEIRGDGSVMAGNRVSYEVGGRNYAYDVKELYAKKGDTVSITFRSDEGKHDFVIDEFNVQSTLIRTGGATIVEFVVDKTGTFEYYCSVGSHRELGMVGKLIVE